MVKVPITCTGGCDDQQYWQAGIHLKHQVERYFDGYTISNLDLLKEAVEKKWDGVLLYGGYEGDGKTTKCSQDLAYLDSSFDLSRVCFTVGQLSKLMDELPPGSAIMYDESWKDTSSQNRYGSDQRKFIRMLTEKRKKRLYIGIVTATFFDLNKYFVIHRSRAYIHIYTKGLERGYFSFYNRQEKQDLYIKGKKEWNLMAAQPSFRGRFTHWIPFNSEEYEKKKDENTLAAMEEAQKYDMSAYRDGQDEVLLYLRDVVEFFKTGVGRGLFTKVALHLGITPIALETRISKYRITRQERLNARQLSLSNTLIPEKFHLPKNAKNIFDPLEERGFETDGNNEGG
jgi:hypothetical protein